MAGWTRATPKPVPVYVAPNQIFDYAQGNDNRWKIKLISSKGACQGLSIFWVIKTANGVNFCTWLGPPKAAASWGSDPPKMGKEMDEVIRVMQQQDKIFKLPNGSRALNMKWAKDRIAEAERGGGSTTLKAQGELVLLQGATAKQIAGEVTKEDGYVFFGFSGSFGGHAVAAWVGTPVVHFFDPNYGEYSFQDVQSFHTWFDQNLMPCYTNGNLDTAEIMHFQ
jgi:hypothetical protein